MGKNKKLKQQRKKEKSKGEVQTPNSVAIQENKYEIKSVKTKQIDIEFDCFKLLSYSYVEKLTDDQKLEYYETCHTEINETICDYMDEKDIKDNYIKFKKEFLNQLRGENNEDKEHLISYKDGEYQDKDKLDFYNKNKKFFLNYYDEDTFDGIVEKATNQKIDNTKEYPDVAKVALVNDCIDKVKAKTSSVPSTLLEILELDDESDEIDEDSYTENQIFSLEREELNKYKIAFINEIYLGELGNGIIGETLESAAEPLDEDALD